MIVRPADQPPERLGEPRPHDPIIVRGAASGQPARGVEHRRPRPWHAFHHHQPQRCAGHVHPVAQRIGAEQRGVRIIAEDIDQRARIDRIDMLGVERQPGMGEPIGRILFAGEHTAGPRGGYADGAMLTGLREAKRLLRRPSVELTAP